MIRVDCDSPCALPCLQESSSLQESICHVFAIYFFQFLHFSVCPWLTYTCLVQLSIFQMVPLQLEGDRHGATPSAKDQAVGSCCAHCRLTVDKYLAYMCIYIYTFIFMMLYDYIYNIYKCICISFKQRLCTSQVRGHKCCWFEWSVDPLAAGWTDGHQICFKFCIAHPQAPWGVGSAQATRLERSRLLTHFDTRVFAIPCFG